MTMYSGNGLGFDGLLEKELHRQVGGLSGPSSQVTKSAYHAAFLQGETMTHLSSLTALASSKAAAGLAVAGLAVGGVSAAAAVGTGSPNPAVWGKTVVAAVATCKADVLKAGDHGIGQCVSKVAKEKGDAVRAAHPAGGPASHPTGASGAPVGPPASIPPGSKHGHPTGPPVNPPAHP